MKDKIGRRGFITEIAAMLTAVLWPHRRASAGSAEFMPDVLDWQNDASYARQYDIVDAATGEPHPNMDIFYADARRGVVRFYRRNAEGNFYAAFAHDGVTPLPKGRRILCYDHDGNKVVPDVCIAWGEQRAAIRFVRKTGA